MKLWEIVFKVGMHGPQMKFFEMILTVNLDHVLHAYLSYLYLPGVHVYSLCWEFDTGPIFVTIGIFWPLLLNSG